MVAPSLPRVCLSLATYLFRMHVHPRLLFRCRFRTKVYQTYVSWRYLHVDGAPFYLTPSEINYSVCPGHTLVPRAQCAPCN